jgi:hypothetical protein
MAIVADFAQTFLIDSKAVSDSPYVFLSKLHLYFKSKPEVATSNRTNTGGVSSNPGATVYICETDNVNNIAVPNLNSYVAYGRARVEYDSIITSTTGQDSTVFEFKIPAPIATDKFYAFVVKFDNGDTQFSLWRNKAGETFNEAQSSPVTKGALDGQFFVLTNGDSLAPLIDTDLKFNLIATLFNTNPSTYSIVNKNLEFLTFFKDSLNGKFIGGESVFCNTGYVSAQTVSITANTYTVTGTNTKFLTNFVVGDNIVISSGSKNIIRKISSVVSDIELVLNSAVPVTNGAANYLIAPTARVYDYNKQKGFVVLTGSTANSTFNFSPSSTSNTLVGEQSNASVTIATVENFPVNQYLSEFKILTPPGTTTNTYVNFANSSYITVETDTEIRQFAKTNFNSFIAYVASRTNEVAYPSGLVNGKSVNFTITFDTDNPFLSPVLDEEDLIFHSTSVYSDSYYAGEEIPGNGTTAAKYIGKTVNLANNSIAEDIKVYVTAYRPIDTEVQVYVKFYNDEDSDNLEDKSWTRLINQSPANLYSSIENENDFVELEYGLSSFPMSSYDDSVSGISVPGAYTFYFGSDVNSGKTLFGTQNLNADILKPGDIIRIFNPLFPQQSIISEVEGVFNNDIRITTDIGYFVAGSDQTDYNVSLGVFDTGGLNVERVLYPGMAFKDFLNSGVLTYHNSGLSRISGYTAFKVKIVLASSSSTGYYPIVDDIRAIALSV